MLSVTSLLDKQNTTDSNTLIVVNTFFYPGNPSTFEKHRGLAQERHPDLELQVLFHFSIKTSGTVDTKFTCNYRLQKHLNIKHLITQPIILQLNYSFPTNVVHHKKLMTLLAVTFSSLALQSGDFTASSVKTDSPKEMNKTVLSQPFIFHPTADVWHTQC